MKRKIHLGESIDWVTDLNLIDRGKRVIRDLKIAGYLCERILSSPKTGPELRSYDIFVLNENSFCTYLLKARSKLDKRIRLLN